MNNKLNKKNLQQTDIASIIEIIVPQNSEEIWNINETTNINTLNIEKSIINSLATNKDKL